MRRKVLRVCSSVVFPIALRPLLMQNTPAVVLSSKLVLIGRDVGTAVLLLALLQLRLEIHVVPLS